MVSWFDVSIKILNVLIFGIILFINNLVLSLIYILSVFNASLHNDNLQQILNNSFKLNIC